MMSKKALTPKSEDFFQADSKKDRLFKYLEKYPNVSYTALFFKFPDVSKHVIYTYRREYRMNKRIDGYSAEKIRAWLEELLFVLQHKSKPLERLTKEELKAIRNLEKFLRGERI